MKRRRTRRRRRRRSSEIKVIEANEYGVIWRRKETHHSLLFCWISPLIKTPT